MVADHAFTPLFVDEFASRMSTFYGASVENDFKHYTYGTKSASKAGNFPKDESIHRKMTLAEIKKFL